MSDTPSRLIATIGLVAGAMLGVAGTFVPSPSLRGLLWGLDGTALIVATALLAIHHARRGNELAAAGFLVFVVGETLVVSGSAMSLEASAPSFGAGVALWSASLVTVGFAGVIGLVAAGLFGVVAAQIFLGSALTSLSKPLPFFAYPFFAATLFGWAWAHYRA